MLETPVYSVRRDDWILTTDRSRLDLALIHGYLTRSYWSPGIPRHVVAKALEHSLCFGLFQHGAGGEERQIGFGRAITDLTTLAYLADVFVLPDARGTGAGSWMIDKIVSCPLLIGIRSFLLSTRDAHELYARFGFQPIQEGSRVMAARYEMPWFREDFRESYPGETAAPTYRSPKSGP